MPYPREQGSCNSCVGQAVAAAVQMSLAYTTREPVDKFNVSAGALYYCVAGGRTCKTGECGTGEDSTYLCGSALLVEGLNVSAGVLYYCVAGGGTCKTGTAVASIEHTFVALHCWLRC